MPITPIPASSAHVVASWAVPTKGRNSAAKGVLVASDGGSRRVSAPVRRDDGTFAGDGWTFRAAPGWIVRDGARRGDYEVVRQQQ